MNLLLVLVLILTLVGGLIRVALGPTEPDRMLAAQLMGTTGVGVLLLLSETFDRPSLMDVALVFSLLAAVTTVAFVRRSYLPPVEDERHHDVG